MMRTSAPKESGANALKTGKRPERAARTAAPNTERPERKEAGETAVGPQHNNGGKNAQLIVKTRPDATPDLPLRQTAQERGGRPPGEVPRKPAPQWPPSSAQRPPTIAQAVPAAMGAMEQNQ